MERETVLLNLCYYDKRNPLSEPTESPFRRELPFHCDNCFYGRTNLANELLEHLYSETVEIKSNFPIEDIKKVNDILEKIMDLHHIDDFPEIFINEMLAPIERVLEANHFNLRDYDV